MTEPENADKLSVVHVLGRLYSLDRGGMDWTHPFSVGQKLNSWTTTSVGLAHKIQ